LLDKESDREPEDRQEDAVVYDHLADVLLALNHPAEAVVQWQRALKLDPNNKSIVAKLAAHPAPTK